MLPTCAKSSHGTTCADTLGSNLWAVLCKLSLVPERPHLTQPFSGSKVCGGRNHLLNQSMPFKWGISVFDLAEWPFAIPSWIDTSFDAIQHSGPARVTRLQ